MTTLYVTGADENYFVMTLILLQSFKENMPDDRLMFCDFGLSGPQQDFLRGQGQLLEMPAELNSIRHVWDRKAALMGYAGTVGWDQLVYLDADMVLIRPLTDEFDRLFRTMRSVKAPIAAAFNIARSTLGATLAADYDFPHFAQRLGGEDIDLDRTYLNSGFFACQSRSLVERWREETGRFPVEVLYEQNAFNIACYRDGGRPLVLDPQIWNLHHWTANKLARDDHGDWRGETLWKANILHCTGPRGAIRQATISDIFCANEIRLFCNDALAEIQIGLLRRYIAENKAALVARGLCG